MVCFFFLKKDPLLYARFHTAQLIFLKSKYKMLVVVGFQEDFILFQIVTMFSVVDNMKEQFHAQESKVSRY